MSTQLNSRNSYLLNADQLDLIFQQLRKKDYQLLAPVISDQTIIYDEVQSVDDLPKGYTEKQGPGLFQLIKTDDDRRFNFTVGAQSWKKFLHPSECKILQSTRTDQKITITKEHESIKKMAFIGVRACELSAILVLDNVLLHNDYQDSIYKNRRDHVFMVAVNCTEPGENCFCLSMNSGPFVTEHFDLSLTEINLDNEIKYEVMWGSEKGKELLSELSLPDSTEEQIQKVNQVMGQVKGKFKKTLDTKNIKKILQQNPEHPMWEEVAKKCLLCANCTMVCPTCFCTNIEDTTDLTGNHAERWRKWDSCFNVDFSYIHGGHIRPSAKARYRQWMTHKLSNWVDQFGTFGCVGCGRCITWCPVGIDITEQAKLISQQQPFLVED